LVQREFLQIVVDDLRYITEEWDDSIEDHALRRDSAVLRRLLVQNDFQRAWRIAGFEKEPRLTAPTLSHTLSRFPRQRIVFAAAGGAVYKGVEVQGVLVAKGRRATGGPPPDKPPQERCGLKDFMEAPCIVAAGDLISRRVLIKYVANKLGGAHFDTARQSGKDDEVLFSELDSVRQQFEVGGKNAIYFELLSIGQVLAKNQDVGRLSRRIVVLLAG
jgi:hypothetical protein